MNFCAPRVSCWHGKGDVFLEHGTFSESSTQHKLNNNNDKQLYYSSSMGHTTYTLSNYHTRLLVLRYVSQNLPSDINSTDLSLIILKYVSHAALNSKNIDTNKNNDSWYNTYTNHPICLHLKYNTEQDANTERLPQFVFFQPNIDYNANTSATPTNSNSANINHLPPVFSLQILNKIAYVNSTHRYIEVGMIAVSKESIEKQKQGKNAFDYQKIKNNNNIGNYNSRWPKLFDALQNNESYMNVPELWSGGDVVFWDGDKFTSAFIHILNMMAKYGKKNKFKFNKQIMNMTFYYYGIKLNDSQVVYKYGRNGNKDNKKPIWSGNQEYFFSMCKHKFKDFSNCNKNNLMHYEFGEFISICTADDKKSKERIQQSDFFQAGDCLVTGLVMNCSDDSKSKSKSKFQSNSNYDVVFSKNGENIIGKFQTVFNENNINDYYFYNVVVAQERYANMHFVPKYIILDEKSLNLWQEESVHKIKNDNIENVNDKSSGNDNSESTDRGCIIS